jgi:hypothetical protein
MKQGLHSGGTSFFQACVMGGAVRWAKGLQEFADRGKMMEALSHEFLYYILSRQGSEAVMREGDYLLLTSAVLLEQLD